MVVAETDMVRNGILSLEQVPGRRKLCDVNILKQFLWQNVNYLNCSLWVATGLEGITFGR
jgi:hypothetical protein